MTPSGKPQPGDVFVHKPTGERATVVERLSGNTCYGVRLRRANGMVVLVTEFDYWMGRTYEYVEPTP